MRNILVFVFLFSALFAHGQSLKVVPPSEGPGSFARYIADSTLIVGEGNAAGDFWLFLPQGKADYPIPVVVFLHGYGVYNPMVYGEWIQHLVLQGQAVIFPRYQDNLFWPRPGQFAEKAAEGIRGGIDWLENHWDVSLEETLVLVGHSYGGTTAASLAAKPEGLDLPPIGGIMMVTPGTSIFRGGILPSYATIPKSVDVLVLVNERDDVVGEVVARKVFAETNQVERKGYYTIRYSPEPPLFVTAHHREPYSVYKPYDVGPENKSTRRALRWTELDAVDFWVYWRMFDAFSDCVRFEEHCELAFPNEEAVTNLGVMMGVPEAQLLELNQLQVPGLIFPLDSSFEPLTGK